MSIKEGQEFYRSLSRKELQSLCKKYGLPARKSSSEMAESLFSFFQEAIGGSIDHFQGSSLSQTILQSAGGGVIHKEPPSSLSGRLEDTPQFHCGHIKCVCPIKNVSSARTYRKVSPSFEFYVSSEEGIKLCVDLNSSPLDWIKDYKNQVSLCKNADSATSLSLHQELGCIGESDNTQIKGSFPHSVNPGEIEDGRVQAETSLSLVMENNIEIDHPDGGNQSSMILPTRPCSVEGLECLGEEQGPISSKTSSGVQNQIISNAESCAKNGCSAILDSDIINVPTEKTACNFAFNSISDGSVDLIAIEHQNSKHDDEICQTLTRQNNSDIENNCIVFPGCLASCSAEMQLSEAGNYHKDTSSSPNKNGEFLRLDDSRDNAVNEQAALATSSENDHCGNHLPTCSEEQVSPFSSLFSDENSNLGEIENNMFVI
ncbi:hypothetical protein GH714_007011 [Hevea brasiliensis]|uniref:Uncharacterized protein n=1 Tax=Hevea brasiliensis TaxID=3981 RepID=A0A6A6N7H0_HEVBR|nr:hypothetical protein GH714_007011 [Hevea brasiliensis]